MLILATLPENPTAVVVKQDWSLRTWQTWDFHAFTRQAQQALGMEHKITRVYYHLRGQERASSIAQDAEFIVFLQAFAEGRVEKRAKWPATPSTDAETIALQVHAWMWAGSSTGSAPGTPEQKAGRVAVMHLCCVYRC